MKQVARLLILVLLLCSVSSALAEVPTEDRAGNPIAIPQKVERIISMAPATTQVLEALDVLPLLVAVDTQTPMYVELPNEVPQFDMMEPDVEGIAMLSPDVVFTSGMSYINGDPYAALVEMGICVIDIPSSSSIAAVEEDILFTAACLDMTDAGERIVSEMQEEIDKIAEIGKTIPDNEKKTVLFEISALPYIYSFGRGTFLDEMLEMIGAVNVFADQEGWLAVNEEDAILANPDIIMTSVNYIEDPIGEIKSREGWGDVTAVKNGNVYYIDNASSSLPNQHIINAMWEMALAVHPEYFAEKAA